MQRVQNFFFTARLNLFTSQRIAAGGIHRLQSDYKLIPQIRDRAGKHRPDAVALADFAPDFTGDALVRRPSHELQRLLRFSFRKNIQVRGLLEIDCQRFFQRSIKDRIGSGVHEIGDQNRVLLGHGASPAHGDEHCQGQRDHQHSGNSHILAQSCRSGNWPGIRNRDFPAGNRGQLR